MRYPWGMRPAALVLALALVTCSRSSEAPAAGDGGGATTTAASSSASATPSLETRALSATTLAEALAITKPHMRDVKDEYDPAAVALGSWALKKMRWQDVEVSPNETSMAAFERDPFAERGKRMCARGGIVDLTIDRGRDGTAPPMAFADVLTAEGDRLMVFAAGTAGTLARGSHARVCGVVTGRHARTSVSGGTNLAVQLVGMFDLPDNRRASL